MTVTGARSKYNDVACFKTVSLHPPPPKKIACLIYYFSNVMSLDGDLESQLPDIRPVSDSTENNTEKKSDDGLTLVTGVQHGILLILTT